MLRPAMLAARQGEAGHAEAGGGLIRGAAMPVGPENFSKGLNAAKRGDYAAALKEWRPLAEQGDASAQFNLGLMYAEGQGVPQDHAEAVKWYRRAAEQGHAGAQNNLGGMYAEGKGVLQDHAEAVKWFRRAAEQGFSPRPEQSRLHVRHGPGRAKGLRASASLVQPGRLEV